MHQSVKYLPGAIKELQAGKVPERREIITVGMPTNALGSMSADFAAKAAKDPFTELPKVYSEFIAYKMTKNNQDSGRNTIELYGMSLGASLAIRTGENLLAENLVTQNLDDRAILPFLQIRAEVPVALSESKIKKLQIPVGFLADAYTELKSPVIKKIEAGKPKFGREVGDIFKQRGIQEQMSDQQKKLKQKVILKIITELGKGLKPKPETRITEVYGLQDLTTYTFDLAKEAKEQQQNFAGTLGQNLLPRKRANERRFVANMPHLNTRFRKNEMRRMRALVETIEKL